MIVFPLVSALLLAASTDPEPIKGWCQYSEPVRERATNTVLIPCNAFVMESGDGGTVFDFGQRSWSASTRFAGRLTGNVLEVDRITLRSGHMLEADGTCEIFYRADNTLAVIACLVGAGAVFYAANFEPSRI